MSTTLKILEEIDNTTYEGDQVKYRRRLRQKDIE